MKMFRFALFSVILGISAPLFGQALSQAQAADQYGRPDARQLLQTALPGLNSAARTDALRRLVLLDLQAGDRPRAEADLAAYRAAGGTDLAERLPTPVIHPVQTVPVPGPLQSFSRMAALSPDLKQIGRAHV